MTEQHALNIFLVDDDPTARAMAVFQLDSLDAHVTEFGSGAACLAALDSAAPPDIAILDVEMPDLDGIALCARMRAAGCTDTEVIFISAHDDLETRLNAYSAGGNDYLVKPFIPEELRHKLEVARRSILARREVAEHERSARAAAFSAMSTMGEMGVIVEFMRASFACATPEEIGALLCEALTQYGLRGFVHLHDERMGCCYSSTGRCTALEASILDHLKGMDRIFQFRDRLSINYPHVTLLIPDLPIDEHERAGRLRDHLAILVEGAEARFLALSSDMQRRAQGAAVRAAAAELSAVVEENERAQAQIRLRAMQVDEAYLENLARVFVSLGLSEDQEKALADMAQRAHMEISALHDEASGLSDRLRPVACRMEELARS